VSVPITRVAALVSGRGTNLRALIEAQARGALGPARIVLVVSNVAAAPALEHARRAGVPAEFCDPRGLSRETYDARLLERLRARRIELLCLAGYMRILSAAFVESFAGPILNVHPSLLPAFPGLHAQRQAVEHGVKVSGASVHLVDAGLDSGPIVLQEAVTVHDDDTPDTLAARILASEHRLYPRALRLVAEGRYRLEGRRVVLTRAEEG
jgi:phosphoribosylglycinamide formyltransferase-1